MGAILDQDLGSIVDAINPYLPIIVILVSFLGAWIIRGLVERSRQALKRENRAINRTPQPSLKEKAMADRPQISSRADDDIHGKKKEDLHQDFLNKVPNILRQMLEAEDPTELAQSLNNTFCHLFDLTQSTVWIRDEDRLVLKDNRGVERLPLGTEVLLDESYLGFAARSIKPMTQSSFSAVSGLQWDKIKNSQKSWDTFNYYVPIGLSGLATEGVVAFMGKRSVKLEFLKHLTTVLGSLAALTMVNMRQLLEIRQLSELDFLTGLPNRKAFMKKLGTLMEGGAKEKFGFLMVDVDHFKKFNDEHGHQVGDQVLQHLSDILRDAADKDEMAARLGGEEFGLLLTSDVEDMAARVDKIRQTVADSILEIPMRKPLSITISGGLALYPADMVTVDDLIRVADDRLYKAKEGGRNQIAFPEIPLEK